MLTEGRVNPVKAALACIAAAAVANRYWLHWCEITPADLIASVLAVATVAAGQLPGANAWLLAMWASWGVLCLGELLFLRLIHHIGVEVIMALGFCAIFAEAALRELEEARNDAGAGAGEAAE